MKQNNRTLKKYYCKDCNKRISINSGLYGKGRCKKCALLLQKGKNHPNWQGGKKSKIYLCKKCKKNRINYYTYLIGKGHCQKCSGILHREFKGVTGNKIVKHHKDLNKKNDKKSNILYLKAKIHDKLHQNAYKYLVKTNQIKQYTKWFFKNLIETENGKKGEKQ